MITADTITDEQIAWLYAQGAILLRDLGFATAFGFPLRRAVRAKCAEVYNKDRSIIALRLQSQDAETIDCCNRALGARIYEGQAWDRASFTDRYVRCATSRARCAEILNARKAVQP